MSDQSGWTFLSNHGHVMVCLARNPDARLREIAADVGITERAVQSIVADLVRDGYLDKERFGRRNRYQVHPEKPMRHPLESDHLLGELLDAIAAVPGDDGD